MKTDLTRLPDFAALLLSMVLVSCAGADIRPVDIYPEDICSSCRMAISDERFAGEIVTVDGDVFKFDDLGCMNTYLARHQEHASSARFYKDYLSKEWLSADKAIVVPTGLFTPMGSGLAAFKDSSEMRQVVRRGAEGE
jgi:copper chaperone NosL